MTVVKVKKPWYAPRAAVVRKMREAIPQYESIAGLAYKIFLLKVVTHLGGFRGDAAFSICVYRIAHNHLLTAATRAVGGVEPAPPEVSLASAASRYDELRSMFDAASVFRAHPAYAAPGALAEAIRGLLGAGGWMTAG